ncbi:STAGA complex 65 subunit gamma-like isoform X2 [Bacillus rossius redtenbacheri]|uniref:STAGA complex 65 subunit gamma-like isoform X2 n=1 Tax=Bacillus rossius redtenbacheri TaxID=93214 RepID=UPI002FDCECD3
MDEASFDNVDEVVNRRLWGEMEPRTDSAPISLELQKSLIAKAMKQETLKLYQPCLPVDAAVVEVPLEVCKMDDNLLATIKLIQHSKRLAEMIQEITPKLRDATSAAGHSQTLSNLSKNFPPPVPAMPDVPPVEVKNVINTPFRHINKTDSPFSLGQAPPQFRLNAVNARHLLRKAVATIFAHVGYDTASQVLLDTVTDVAKQYILNFTRLMRIAHEHESLLGPSGFPDIMERVFHDMKIGSMTTLHDFYQNRVILHHQKERQVCQDLTSTYAELRAEFVKLVGDNLPRSSVMEVEEGEGDVPEIHFPALADDSVADQLQPSLKPGFQMLHSLEQEEQLQNFEAAEEIELMGSLSQEAHVATPTDNSSMSVLGFKTKKWMTE